MREFNNNWQVKSLGEVAEVIAGQSPPSSTYNNIQDGLPFFQGKVDFGIMFPKVRVWCNEPVKIAKPNDILISVRAPVGPTNICNVESCIGRGLSAIRAGKNSYYKYIFYFLRYNEDRISTQGRGSTFSAITQGELRKIKVPLPPLPIQKQIAEILEKADQAKQKRKEANKLTDEFLQSVFIEMFGDPVKNPKGWETKLISEIAKVGTGGTPSREKPEYFTGDIPWVKTTEVTNDRIFDTEEKITKKALEESNCTIFPKGTIVIALYGQGLTRGRTSILEIEACTNQACGTVLPSENIDSIFLWKQLLHFYNHLRSISRGGNQPNLNLSFIKNLRIILPPPQIQQQFAEIVKKTEGLKEKQKQSEQELENLFQSLMQKAFKGELV